MASAAKGQLEDKKRTKEGQEEDKRTRGQDEDKRRTQQQQDKGRTRPGHRVQGRDQPVWPAPCFLRENPNTKLLGET